MPRPSRERHGSAATTARGSNPGDLVVTNVGLLNVFTREIYRAHLVIRNGLVARALPSNEQAPQSREYFDGTQHFAIAGLVDGHLHIESSMVLPPAFAAAVVPRGVLTVIADPHEIANVMGLPGVRLMADAAKDRPLDVFLQAPSCVPATNLETSGAEIGPEQIRELLGWDEVLALGEVMDFNAVLTQKGRAAAVLAEAVDLGAIIEGHAPNLTGRDLAAYIASGVTSDHTFVTPELAEERLRAGMTLQLQLKTLAPETIRRASALAKSLNLCLVTDDVMPDDLVRTGHLDHVLRTAIRMGMDPIEAIRAVTIAPAMRFGLTDRGAIAPGRWAHIVLTKSLEDFRADYVFHAGRLVAKDGELIVPLPKYSPPEASRRTIRIAPPTTDRFRLLARGAAVTTRIIQMRPDSTYTEGRTDRLSVKDGAIDWELSDLCLAAVFERPGRAGPVGYGLVRHALRDGAIPMTWAHDSHNLLVLGRSPADMAQAARWVVEAGGGMAAVRGGELLGSVHLPIAGIVSDRSVPEVADELGGFRRALATLGLSGVPENRTLIFGVDPHLADHGAGRAYPPGQPGTEAHRSGVGGRHARDHRPAHRGGLTAAEQPQRHLRITTGAMPRYCLLPGDPARFRGSRRGSTAPRRPSATGSSSASAERWAASPSASAPLASAARRPRSPSRSWPTSAWTPSSASAPRAGGRSQSPSAASSSRPPTGARGRPWPICPRSSPPWLTFGSPPPSSPDTTPASCLSSSQEVARASRSRIVISTLASGDARG